MNGEAGEVVVPLGNPVRFTDTEPAKPFTLEIETEKFALELPGAAVMVLVDKPIVKSCAAVIVRGRFTEWVRAPDVPLTVSA